MEIISRKTYSEIIALLAASSGSAESAIKMADEICELIESRFTAPKSTEDASPVILQSSKAQPGQMNRRGEFVPLAREVTSCTGPVAG